MGQLFQFIMIKDCCFSETSPFVGQSMSGVWVNVGLSMSGVWVNATFQIFCFKNVITLQAVNANIPIRPTC